MITRNIFIRTFILTLSLVSCATQSFAVATYSTPENTRIATRCLNEYTQASKINLRNIDIAQIETIGYNNLIDTLKITSTILSTRWLNIFARDVSNENDRNLFKKDLSTLTTTISKEIFSRWYKKIELMIMEKKDQTIELYLYVHNNRKAKHEEDAIIRSFKLYLQTLPITKSTGDYFFKNCFMAKLRFLINTNKATYKPALEPINNAFDTGFTKAKKEIDNQFFSFFTEPQED